jgi:hypothetical protein
MRERPFLGTGKEFRYPQRFCAYLKAGKTPGVSDLCCMHFSIPWKWMEKTAKKRPDKKRTGKTARKIRPERKNWKNGRKKPETGGGREGDKEGKRGK